MAKRASPEARLEALRSRAETSTSESQGEARASARELCLANGLQIPDWAARRRAGPAKRTVSAAPPESTISADEIAAARRIPLPPILQRLPLLPPRRDRVVPYRVA